MGAREQTGAQRAEQFPHLGNYTLTPGRDVEADFFLKGVQWSGMCILVW